MGRNFEKLIEYIINADDANARKLFHNIVVSKSREIYESLEMEENVDGVDQYIDEVETEENSGMMEADDEVLGDEGEGEFGQEGDAPELEPEMGDELGGEDLGMDSEMGEEPNMEAEPENVEARVDDLESAIDELKAEFEKLMAGEEGEEGAEDLEGADADLDDAEADIEDADADFDDAEASEEGEGEDEPEGEEAADDDEDKELDEFLIREYTEKVPAPKNTDEAGNKKSPIISGKNDMGGTAKNLVQGGKEEGRKVPAPPVKGYPGPKEAAKGAFKKQAPKPTTKDESSNKKSVIESKKPKARK